MPRCRSSTASCSVSFAWGAVALACLALAFRTRDKLLGKTSRVEHPAILEPCLALLEQGLDITFLPVDAYGQVRTDEVAAAIRPETILVSIMHANNEVGTIQPISAIAAVTRKHGVLLHTDAAQSVGKIPTRVDDLGVDLLTVAGHKLYAPKGIGALYVRQGVPLRRWLYGAGQERGLRPGTENVLEIVGLGEAATLVVDRGAGETLHLQRLRDRLQNKLQEAIPDAVVHGHPDERLPNTLSMAFPGWRTDELLSALRGVAVSAGAACHSDSVKISHVLEAMGGPWLWPRELCVSPWEDIPQKPRFTRRWPRSSRWFSVFAGHKPESDLKAFWLGAVMYTQHCAVGDEYGGVPIGWSLEHPILGTAGALRAAAERGLLPELTAFTVANGDLFTTFPLGRLLHARQEAGVLSALAVIPNRDPGMDTPLWADARGRLVAVGGPRPSPDASGPWLFTGLQTARRVIVERVPPGYSELARDVLVPSAKKGDGAFALVPYRIPEDGLWFDLGTPERLAEAEKALTSS